MGILLPYQRELVNRRNRFEINVKARQVGYSFAFAYKMLKRCVLENRNQLIVSASLRQSKRVMYFIEQFYKGFKMLEQFRDLNLAIDTQTEKRFNNGKSIWCLPANPETVRSFAGDVLLDEFALYKDDVRIYESIYPSITRGYDIVINSTPLGKSNLFFEIFDSISNPNKKKYKNFVPYSITIHDAIKQGLNIDIEELKSNFDEESFTQEFECEFVDESTSYFSYELLRTCIENYETIKGPTRLGTDVGRTNDKTSTAAVTEYLKKYYLTRLDTLGKTNFDTQYDRIVDMYTVTGALSLLIDKGAIGYQLAEELERDLMNCKGVFTNQTAFMNDVVTFAKKLMEQGRFKMPADRELINDFHKIKKIITSSNNISFQIPRDKTGHGDRAVAVMLALYGFKEDYTAVSCTDTGDGENEYESITQQIGI